MKKQLLLIGTCVLVLLCLGYAVVISNDRQTRVQAAQSSQVKKAQDTLKQHDAVNQAALKNAGDRIVQLQGDKATLCAQVKAAKLVQPLCN